ncbi:hypothetical protein [Siminovitchia sp. 179-K 8D1 HS]
MLRLLLSIIILALMITYLAIPLMKWIRRFGKSEAKRIDEAFKKE